MSAINLEPGPVLAQEGPSHWLVDITGLLLAAMLTATSFWAANTSVLSAPEIPLNRSRCHGITDHQRSPHENSEQEVDAISTKPRRFPDYCPVASPYADRTLRDAQ